MSDLTAIDILLEPDASMLDRAERENTRMLSSVPSPPGPYAAPWITTTPASRSRKRRIASDGMPRP